MHIHSFHILNKAKAHDVNIADSIKEKVRAAGGQTEGFLRCSFSVV